MATLKDVAQLANVDVSTVSRALNGSSLVHPDTKTRVLAAAEELGYRPNLAAKSLRQGKNNTIGIIVPTIRMSIFSDIVQSVSYNASVSGYSTVIAVTNEDPQLEQESILRMHSGFVDGIIITATDKNTDLLRRLYKDGFPIVQTVRSQVRNIPSILADYYSSAYEAAMYLHDHGCRKIGFVDGPVTLAPYHDRYIGYKDAIHELGLEDLSIITDSPTGNLQHFRLGYNGVNELLERCPELDGVMVAVDLQGLGAIRAFKEKGIHLPDQMRLISLTGNTIGRLLETPMTAMEMPGSDMGREAVISIVEQIESHNISTLPARVSVFNYTLTERET